MVIITLSFYFIFLLLTLLVKHFFHRSRNKEERIRSARKELYIDKQTDTDCSFLIYLYKNIFLQYFYYWFLKTASERLTLKETRPNPTPFIVEKVLVIRNHIARKWNCHGSLSRISGSLIGSVCWLIQGEEVQAKRP